MPDMNYWITLYLVITIFSDYLIKNQDIFQQVGYAEIRKQRRFCSAIPADESSGKESSDGEKNGTMYFSTPVANHRDISCFTQSGIPIGDSVFVINPVPIDRSMAGIHLHHRFHHYSSH